LQSVKLLVSEHADAMYDKVPAEATSHIIQFDYKNDKMIS